MKTTLEIESVDDAELVARSCKGEREAFGAIVERYQSLICGLTYSACGNLHASEDLAQVTFITAWCQLCHLQEPSKLKSWLCGIARNVANNSFRQDKRSPVAQGEPLELTAEISSGAPTPQEQAISSEEEAILWRSLSVLPPAYREPLVLFYRQQQSVAEVAEALELSEDAVKQRLSRGRAMLTQQVTAFVEGALRQTRPNSEFTAGVLAALPPLTAVTKIATVTAAAKAVSVAKSAAAIASGGSWGLLGSMGLATWANIENTKSPRERRFIVRKTCVGFAVMIIGFAVAFPFFGMVRKWNPLAIDISIMTVSFGLAVYSAVMFEYGYRRRRRIQIEDGTHVVAEWEPRRMMERPPLDPGDSGERANAYVLLAFALGLIVILMQALYEIAGKHRAHGLILLAVCGVALFRNLRAWRKQPRFDARQSTLIKFVGVFGVFTLAFCNLELLRRLSVVGNPWVFATFNLGVMLAYGLLIGVLVWYRRNQSRREVW